MTESEKQEIIREIFETLNQYSKTISQLEPTSQAAADDIVELGNGRRISIADLLKGAKVDIEELKKLFLGKYGPDETEHLLKLLGGIFVRGGIDTDSIIVGDYVPGFLGSGAYIGPDGDGELRSLKVYGSLEVSDYRFNRIDVISGETWNTFAFGKIKAVDTEACIAIIDLVDGELLTSHVNDINRGIFHSITGGNELEEGIDGCGFKRMQGFTTSYFTPVALLSDGSGFEYALKPGTTAHPCVGMKFAAYGNFTDKSRRSSAYSTRTTEILLANVNTWQINPDKHYMFVKGLLDGITIGGMELHGYSTLQRNAYLMGGKIQFTPEQMEEMKGNDAYSVNLSTYEGVIVVDSSGNVMGSMNNEYNVVSDDKNIVSSDRNVVASRYKLSTRVQAFRGKTELRYNTVMETDSYVVQVNAKGVEYSFVGGVLIVTKVTDIANAYVDFEINCDGVAVFTKSYHITAVRNGSDGTSGTNGADGVNGKDGVSIVFKGDFPSHPANPQNGWSYYNTTDKKSYVYQSGAWYQMTVDGVDGANGSDGLSVDYKGDLANPPANPQKNWCYRDTDNGCVYLYNGSAWVLMIADGSDGTDGANGSNGLSVFITYNDSESQPATPTGSGTSGGWHTAPNTECVWMSQKVAADASSGSWGTPIRIKGTTGPQGVPGAPGKDGKVLYTWIRYADSSTGGGISNNPTGKLYIGLAYNKETQVESNTPSDYMWSLIKGTDGADGRPGNDGANGTDGKNGTDGVPGAPGADGKTTYTWIAYADNANGSDMYQIPNDNTKYIGIAVNKDTKIEGTNHADYTWSRFKGSDGADGRPGEDGKPGTDANLLPWIKTWNGYATELGEEYIVTPKMFSGTQSADGKLTGIAQGKKCITIDGVERTGIFALVDNEVVFELDPVKRKYKFKGDIYSFPLVLTDENFIKYGDITIIGTLNKRFYVDLRASGLNLQFGKYFFPVVAGDPIIVLTNIEVRLPRLLEFEGAELKIILVDNSMICKIYDVARYSSTSSPQIIRETLSATPFTQYILKCVVCEPASGRPYPYDLVDGKAVEWVRIS